MDAANPIATMSDTTPLPNLADYEAIEAAVMETARGRWFLAEHARRVRAAETGLVLSAIARLEAGVADDRLRARDTAALEADLAAMAANFTRMAAELTAVIMDARSEIGAPPRAELAPLPDRFALEAFEPSRNPPDPIAPTAQALRRAPPETAAPARTAAPPTVRPDAPPTAEGPARRSVTERMSALADLDLLDTREKLRRFT